MKDWLVETRVRRTHAHASSLVCLLRRHEWHSEDDHESRHTTWSCRRCGLEKVTYADFLDQSGKGTGGTGLPLVGVSRTVESLPKAIP